MWVKPRDPYGWGSMSISEISTIERRTRLWGITLRSAILTLVSSLPPSRPEFCIGPKTIRIERSLSRSWSGIESLCLIRTLHHDRSCEVWFVTLKMISRVNVWLYWSACMCLCTYVLLRKVICYVWSWGLIWTLASKHLTLGIDPFKHGLCTGLA